MNRKSRSNAGKGIQRFAFLSRRKINTPSGGDPLKTVSDISSLEDNRSSVREKAILIPDRFLVTNIEKKPAKEIDIKPLKRSGFSYSSFVKPGVRRKDEDLIIVKEDLSFYAVCDGHRDKKAAEFCRENLCQILEKLLRGYEGYKDTCENIKRVSNHSVAKEILSACIVNCHEAARDVITNSGCTIVAVWFYRLTNKKDDVYFISANAGDARSVLGRYPKLMKAKTASHLLTKKSLFSVRFSRKKASKKSLLSETGNGKAKRRTLRTFWEQTAKEKAAEKPKITAERLSYDHKATDENEVKRVTEAGGMIFGGNLECMLQVTRGIGDHDFEPGFTAQPYLSPVLKVTHELRFIILSSDGIFDVMTDQEAVLAVEEEICQYGLSQTSIVLGSQALEKNAQDDLSAIIVQLN